MISTLKKYFKILLLVAAVLAGLFYYFGYMPIYSNNINADVLDKTIYIPSNSSFDKVVSLLERSKIIKNLSSFKTVSGWMNYKKDIVPAGKYIFENGMNNRQIIGKLRAGDQNPSKMVINNVRTLRELAGITALYIESDSMTIWNHLNDPQTYSKYNYSSEDFLSLFIPNTYEIFWTTTPEKFVERMHKEHTIFWNNERMSKIKEKNITTTEAYIIASIVEKESQYAPERPTIAGVYLNRLARGIKLQADPTVVFALGDFTLQRVLYKHLNFDSPYNTYLYPGLPPGPICMPSINSLESVVNSEDHNYLFFCAKADNSGTHAFAQTYEEHMKNAALFSAWLNSQNIK